MALTLGSLFSGIGGLDLGLERAGMVIRWQAEVDPYACRVLAKHWPAVANLGDVREVDWGGVEPVDVVCGGFPCQPTSTAGRRRGREDPRWLWPEFARCLRVLRPGYVVVENVPGLLVAGMGEVLGDLARLGYDTEWTRIPAAALGAPHLRWRVFVVAYPVGQPVRDEPRRVHGPGRPGAAVVGNDGPVGWWATEPDVGRMAHGVPCRVDRLRCLGNAVVPQVAEWVGRRLVALEHLRNGLAGDPEGTGHLGHGGAGGHRLGDGR